MAFWKIGFLSPIILLKSFYFSVVYLSISQITLHVSLGQLFYYLLIILVLLR